MQFVALFTGILSDENSPVISERLKRWTMQRRRTHVRGSEQESTNTNSSGRAFVELHEQIFSSVNCNTFMSSPNAPLMNAIVVMQRYRQLKYFSYNNPVTNSCE